MMVPLVLVAIIQAEQIKVLETEVSGRADTDIAHQRVDTAKGGTGLPAWEVVPIEHHPWLTELEDKCRLIEECRAIRMDHIRTQE
ncbi:hypothetical protein D3C86_1927320 [compost metagenome]